MSELRRVFLVGPMGAGKTTIGRSLAEILALEFIDSDQEIETRSGADIPWIFDVEGEEGFRERESRMIDELTLRDDVVLATGGGAVLRPENRAAMSERGCVVYLYASLEQQLERTSRDRNRPLLQVDDPGARLRELMDIRDPLYREIADHIVDTGGRSARAIAQKLARQLTD